LFLLICSGIRHDSEAAGGAEFADGEGTTKTPRDSSQYGLGGSPNRLPER